jgi:septal ring factor EnvC (AmiA/AmiB activator)
MSKKASLFDDVKNSEPTKPKEAKFLDRLKDLDDKIAAAINKVKTLKAEKAKLEEKVAELEKTVNERDAELKRLSSEKTDVRGQIESLLDELESIED